MTARRQVRICGTIGARIDPLEHVRGSQSSRSICWPLNKPKLSPPYPGPIRSFRRAGWPAARPRELAVQWRAAYTAERPSSSPRRGRLHGKENLPTDRPDLATRMRFDPLRSSKLKTARTWALTESLRGGAGTDGRTCSPYFKHRITNAGSEAINTVVQMLKKRPTDTATSRTFHVLPAYLKPPT
jgi:hypothetical protein